MAQYEERPRFYLDRNVTMAEFRQWMERRTDVDPFGTGFEPSESVTTVRTGHPATLAYSDVKLDPSMPNWQKGHRAKFRKFLAAFEPGPGLGLVLESTTEYTSIRTRCNPWLLNEDLTEHLRENLPDELTIEEFAELWEITVDEVNADIDRAYLPFKIVPQPVTESLPERWGFLIDTHRFRDMLAVWGRRSDPPIS